MLPFFGIRKLFFPSAAKSLFLYHAMHMVEADVTPEVLADVEVRPANHR